MDISKYKFVFENFWIDDKTSIRADLICIPTEIECKTKIEKNNKTKLEIE